MAHEKYHARQPDPKPAESTQKAPSSLPGPNRFPDARRVGEALAPGTVPDDERERRQDRKRPETQNDG